MQQHRLLVMKTKKHRYRLKKVLSVAL